MVETHGDYILGVTYRFDAVRDTEYFQRILEQQMRKSGLRRVIVDARQHVSSHPDANDSMWTWVANSNLLERMAIINESPNLATAIRMRNLASKNRKVRAFQSKIEAERWMAER